MSQRDEQFLELFGLSFSRHSNKVKALTNHSSPKSTKFAIESLMEEMKIVYYTLEDEFEY